MNRGEKKKTTIVQKAGVTAAVTAILFGLLWTAQNFIGSYKDSIASESASHLVDVIIDEETKMELKSVTSI